MSSLMISLRTLCILISCHLLGDFPLQPDFLAKTKGKDFYNMLAHCFLYCVPFGAWLSWEYGFARFFWVLPILFGTHLIIDSLKATFNKIDYITDQMLHYIVLVGVAFILRFC